LVEYEEDTSLSMKLCELSASVLKKVWQDGIMERKIITTSDGSHSIFVPELNEHYHSIHGAMQESNHVFIDAGLKQISKEGSEINILEIGMGTGLNVLLTFFESEKSSLKINYTTIEAFPVSENIIRELNYAELISTNDEILRSLLQTTFKEIHHSEWDKEISLSKNFILKKIKNKLQKIDLNAGFNLIYFDAFGPPVQPEMWMEDIFRKIANATVPKGILVTYCAKGEVKRTLKKVGFTVESIPGPPGKREMIRAVKN
jgi:tRNA U34 5-methylaminomethyl-2-thiouridine-forming methyltransferase MnmC